MAGRLARLERIIRKIALWPSQEDIDRWHREDTEANTVWHNGRPIFVIGFDTFGARADIDALYEEYKKIEDVGAVEDDEGEEGDKND